ncbi:prolyl oligopeptidase family serine peptidase [Longimicrobium sp.]|uniref:prolyl oligopeptidase family serine peptidase n=1 Tax=Longimicrobium sp. TaxID=2029185 RepID=UPI002B5A278F|nr:prolyl oligopeptidase family serine peptidase [Longimicrobium sp.]HSU14499.1 prolyl oligopeptidase family serine peptidase [Longimicrobium sp.]
MLTPIVKTRALAVLAAAALAAGPAGAQATRAAQPAAARPAGGWLMPPAPIPQILDAPTTPALSVAPGQRTVAVLGRENLPGIGEMAEPWLPLAGYRINPRTNGWGAARVGYLNGISFQDLAGGAKREVRLPPRARAAYAQWSPDGSKLAFTNFTETGIELWVADARTGVARRLLPAVLNAAFGSPYRWAPDGQSILALRVPAGRGAAPERSRVPDGPVIQESSGRAAPVRTLEDMLKSPHDERLFEYYFTSQLVRVPVSGAVATNVGQAGIISSFDPSPDGRWILMNRVHRPYSYLVGAGDFPYEAVVTDARGAVVKRIVDQPLAENLPPAFDAVITGPRQIEWRGDAPATLVWAEAQDEGDPRKNVPVHDRLMQLDAPFTAPARTLMDLDQRFATVFWGRGDFAMVVERWWNTRREKRFAINPSNPGQPRLLADRSYQDRYGDPGAPALRRDTRGEPLLLFTPDGQGIYLTGSGASQRGDYPFLDRMALADGKTTRVWQAADPYYEEVVTVLEADGSRILTRRESQKDAPNYFVRTLPGGQAVAITNFPDPAPQLAGITRQLVTYKRADGVQLSGTLYLPPNYDPQRDGRLPMLMWAYPAEFRDAAAAAQVQGSPNRFSRPGGTSHLFLLTQGYAILDNPTIPIIGEGDREPNDTYVEQLVSSAQAAVDKMVEMGVADRDRIGIGGHSYGAFMTANLLAHSDLFRAGIARSGAYNRTLTPFGFQAEQRTYWQATDIYTKMSPFTFANRINEPILLIHGEMDDNSGTFPIQSERMFAALKGNGATVRYVVLPFEAHGYRGRETTLHVLAEMVNWLDRYVKNAPPRTQQQRTASAPGN